MADRRFIDWKAREALAPPDLFLAPCDDVAVRGKTHQKSYVYPMRRAGSGRSDDFVPG